MNKGDAAFYLLLGCSTYWHSRYAKGWDQERARQELTIGVLYIIAAFLALIAFRE